MVFWIVQALSVAGNALALIAFPLLVLQATGSVTQMGALTAVGTAATIGTGVFAGSVVDRVDRRRIMIVCDLVRVGLYSTIPLCWLFGSQVWLLYVVMALGSCLGMLFQVTYISAVANLVARDQIAVANGRLEATYAAASIAGPVTAGALSGLIGASATIGVDAATFLVSAAGLYMIRFRPMTAGAEDPVASSSRVRGALRDFAVGARFLWRQPVLRSLTLLLSVLTFCTLGLVDILIYHVHHDLGRGDQSVGLVLGSASVGSILAAAGSAAIRRALGFGASWIGAYVLCGAAVALLTVSSAVAAVAAVAAAFSFGSTLGGISSKSLRQEVTPDHLLGRVTSAFWTLHSSLGPLGAAVLTISAAHLGIRSTSLIIGGVCLAVALVSVFTSVRARVPPGAVNHSPATSD